MLGFTASFQVNDHMLLFLTLTAQTLGSSGNSTTDLDGSLIKLTVSWSWHDFLERMNNYMESD